MTIPNLYVESDGDQGNKEVYICQRLTDLDSYIRVASMEGPLKKPLTWKLAHLFKASPQLLAALLPVYKEIMGRFPAITDDSWDPAFQLEISLTVTECRAIIAAIKASKG